MLAWYKSRMSRWRKNAAVMHDSYSQAGDCWANSGATAQKNSMQPIVTIRFKWAVLGSVNHQATTAQTTRIVGTDVVNGVHDISS
jgi:hypothetical protein